MTREQQSLGWIFHHATFIKPSVPGCRARVYRKWAVRRQDEQIMAGEEVGGQHGMSEDD